MCWSVQKTLEWAAGKLQQSVTGEPPESELWTPKLDAEVLLAHCLDQPREFLLTHPGFLLPEPDLNRFQKMIDRRTKREPVAYITGIKEFWSSPFFVRPGVLIPRPETEILVQGVVDLWKGRSFSRPAILDLGTGSGNIAVALAKEIGDARIVATDVSPVALETAIENARKNHVEDRIQFVQTSLLDGLSSASPPFDFIASNPPYIPDSDREKCPLEVREYEPPMALFVKGTGIYFFHKIIRETPKHLRPNGFLCFEIGFDQKEDVKKLFRNQPEFGEPGCLEDLSGYPRVIFARRI